MKTQNRSAFTLIELLVVIAIIAILAALLLPALASAKARSQRAKCASDFRQWGIGMMLFADENEDSLPRERGVANANPWAVVAAQASWNVWYNAVARTMDINAASNYALAPAEFYRFAKLFMCPSTKLNVDLVGTADAFFPRGMNARLVIGSTPIKMTEIVESSRTPLFVDAGAWPEKPLASQSPFDGRPHVKFDRTSIRHSGRGFGVFADGHAESISVQDATNEFSTVIRWNAQ